MQLFYTPNPDFLSLEETNHAKNVLRLKEFETIESVDGKGTFYASKIIKYQKNGTGLEVISKKKEENISKFNVHIAIAPTKNLDRIEWFVEKATEIGVNKITFLHCQHSERKNINIERIEKVAISAIKQSQKATLPLIENITRFADFIKLKNANQARYIAHLENHNRFALIDKVKTTSKSEQLILIGPEGDFSPQEISLALQNNFEPVSLGNSRLRTETAGLYATLAFSIY